MPGLGKRHSISVGGSAGRWTPSQKLDGETPNQWVVDRIGLNMIATIGENISILPAYLNKPAGTEYAYISDNGTLDIGSSDFTLFGWVRTFDKTSLCFLLGKAVTGAAKAGRYGFYSNATTGYIGFQIQSTNTNLSLESTIDASDGWHFVLGEIAQSIGKIRLFIDNIQIGDDSNYTGTFPSLDNVYKLVIGGANTITTGKVSYIAKSAHADSGIFNRLLTSVEKTTLFNKKYVDGPKAYWPLMGGGHYMTDVSGNGYHLTGVTLNSITNTKFGAEGSCYGLDKGFSLYQNGWDEVYVGNKFDGTEIIPAGIPAGYAKTVEGNHPGNFNKHNLANSVLAMTGSSWDRSNLTIFSEEARRQDTFYDATNSATKKYWHVSELTNLKIQSWANENYKGLNFVKVSDHSYKNRKTLDALFSYDTNKIGDYYAKAIIKYCKDYVFAGVFENDNIFWKYEANSILVTNGLKRLKWENATTDKFYLSVDGGLTYPYSINSPQNNYTPIFADITDNGNIAIGFYNKLYISTNNLISLTETSVKDINNDVYIATDYAFHSYFSPTKIEKNGIKMHIWGCYRTTHASDDDDMNIWYTTDEYITVKSCYKAGITDPPNLKARHIHSIIFDGDYFYVTTGDNNALAINECNIIKGTYDWELDTFTWEKWYGDVAGERPYKWSCFDFYDSSILAISDDSNNKTLGLFSCAVTDIGDPSKFNSKFRTEIEAGAFIFDYPNIVAYLAHPTLDRNNIVISNAGVNGFVGNKLYGVPASITTIFTLCDKNEEGYYLLHFVKSSDFIYDKYKNGVLWVKIK